MTVPRHSAPAVGSRLRVPPLVRRLLPVLVTTMVSWAGSGCGDPTGAAASDGAGADATADVAVQDSTPVPGADCEAYDAGDDAWVKRAMPLLLGRLPRGAREVRLLADLIAATDRTTAALALMQEPGFIDRWTRWLLDEAQVNRLGPKEHSECFAVRSTPDDHGELAAHVAAHGPAESDWPGGPFTMLDLARSALWADDLTPFYRAELFAMMARPAVFCGNTPDEEMEATRRREFGAKFAPRYTHRTIECLGCHNSEWAVTDSPDPERDRHWPLPGRLDAAMYRTATGAPDLELFSAFRLRGVLSRESLQDSSEAEDWPQDAVPPIAPWGIDAACGEFVPAEAIGPDPLGYAPFLAGAMDQSGSVWDVEAHLRAGLEALAETPPAWGQTDTVPGPSAFAYLLAQRLANQVWATMTGAPLTMGHGFARNADQHARLLALTERLIATGWSLRELLVAIVLDPVFNPPTPDSCPGGDGYRLPPVLAPFSVEEVDPARRGNGAGDLARRAAAWVLLDQTAHALRWPTRSSFPLDDPDAAGRLRAAGAFLSDSDPGFSGIDFQSRTEWEVLTRDCLPALTGDGSADDWVADIVAEGMARQARLIDVAEAVRDRLLLAPALDEGEADLVRELFEVGHLSVPMAQSGNPELAARRYCGVLLSSPWFLLTGVVQPPSDREPTLVLPAETYEAMCGELAPRVAAATAGGTEVLCVEDTLQIAPR